MRRPADKADLLDQCAIRGLGEKGPCLVGPARAGVDHHRHVDIIEMAFGNEFGFTEHELDLALGNARRSLLDIDEFFGRDRKKDDLAGKMFGDLRISQPYGGPQHPGNLRVVAATMRRAGGRVGERVLRGAQTVELANKGEPRSRGRPGQPPLDASQREPGTRRQPQGAHALGYKGSGLDLVEARFGVAQDRFAKIDDRVGMAVDRLANRALQFALAAHVKSLVGPIAAARRVSG
jgi:hypothetical protein